MDKRGKTCKTAKLGCIRGMRGSFTAFCKYFKAHPFLYLMLIPGFFFLFIYKFWPLYGLEMAFKDYNIFAGSNPMDSIGASEWVGLYWFKRLFSSSQFPVVFRNTLIINFLKILFLFPIPIIASILLNEIGSHFYKKTLTTAIYIPYFFSWVVIYGIFYSLLGSYGVVNTFLAELGFNRIQFFTDQSVFRGVLIFTEGWKEVGYNTIIYLAAITTIDTTLYEAARIDGANRFQVFTRVVIPLVRPGIVSTAIYVFINAWNEFLYALLLVSSSAKTTLSVAVKTLEGADILNWGSMMAASAIVVLPSIIFFILIQNKIAGGLTDGAVK